jgi:serine phosphatase RsbU (regulator of sigma subunit)
LIVRANRGGAYAVESPGLPLGIQPDEGYRSVPFSLAPGDTLLLCTDGLTEARRGREFLGYEGLTELAGRVLNDTASGPLRQAARAILEGARAFARGVLKDDACLLLARRCEAGTRERTN